MKKTLTMLLAAAMLLSSFGCSQKTENAQGGNAKLEGSLVSSEPMEIHAKKLRLIRSPAVKFTNGYTAAASPT